MIFGSSALNRFTHHTKWFGGGFLPALGTGSGADPLSTSSIYSDSLSFSLSLGDSDDDMSMGKVSFLDGKNQNEDITSQVDNSEGNNLLIIGSKQHHWSTENGIVAIASTEAEQEIDGIASSSNSIVKDLAAIIIQASVFSQDSGNIDSNQLNAPQPTIQQQIIVQVPFPPPNLLELYDFDIQNINSSPPVRSAPTKSILKKNEESPPLKDMDISKSCRARANVSFDSKLYVGDAIPPSEYERRGDYIAKCLTPEIAYFIKKELNEIKQDMEVHEASRKNTQFYSV
jgi:hypothetical protein